MEINEVLVPLSFSEAKFYKECLIRARDVAANPAARLGWDQVRRENFEIVFADDFKNLRLSCSQPKWVLNAYAGNLFADGSYFIRRLYELKRLNQLRCPICVEDARNDCVDLICICGVISCEDLCPRVFINNPVHGFRCRIPRNRFFYLNSKSKWIIRMIQQHIEQQRWPSSKILVLSSCKRTLWWLSCALEGLEVDSTLCSGYDETHLIDNFIRSPTTKIMLMTMVSLQVEIQLPSNSCVVVTEAVVSDVELHIFERVRTVEFDTLSRYVLIAAGTVEQIISDEPPFPDRYNSYDEHDRFIGPQFTDLQKIVSLVDRSPDFEVEDDYGYGLEFLDDDTRMMRIREIRMGRIEEGGEEEENEGQGMEEDEDQGEGQRMEEDED